MLDILSFTFILLHTDGCCFAGTCRLSDPSTARARPKTSLGQSPSRSGRAADCRQRSGCWMAAAMDTPPPSCRFAVRLHCPSCLCLCWSRGHRLTPRVAVQGLPSYVAGPSPHQSPEVSSRPTSLFQLASSPALPVAACCFPGKTQSNSSNDTGRSLGHWPYNKLEYSAKLLIKSLTLVSCSLNRAVGSPRFRPSQGVPSHASARHQPGHAADSCQHRCAAWLSTPLHCCQPP